jgi:hypothetical protein
MRRGWRSTPSVRRQERITCEKAMNDIDREVIKTPTFDDVKLILTVHDQSFMKSLVRRPRHLLEGRRSSCRDGQTGRRPLFQYESKSDDTLEEHRIAAL